MANTNGYPYLERLTLDAHVLIWYTEGVKLNPQQVDLIERARKKVLYIFLLYLFGK